MEVGDMTLLTDTPDTLLNETNSKQYYLQNLLIPIISININLIFTVISMKSIYVSHTHTYVYTSIFTNIKMQNPIISLQHLWHILKLFISLIF